MGAYPQNRRRRVLRHQTATRSADRAAGINASGPYPSQSDGTPGNPPGTAASHSKDRAAGTGTTNK